MNELPKHVVNPCSSLLRRVLRWLVLVVGTVAVFESGYCLVMGLAFKITPAFPSLGEKLAFALMNLIAVAFLVWLLHRPFCRVVARLARTRDGRPTLLNRAFRRLFSKRMIPRYLFCLACLATLIGLFYAEEDWRGKRAWEKVRRELEVKGAVLDWNAYIPAPVPDEQNIFKAPKMTEWFVREAWNAAARGGPSRIGNTNAPFSRSPFWNTKRPPTLLAEANVVPPGGPLPAEKVDAILRLDDPGDREAAAKLIRERVGPCTGDVWIGLTVARSLDQIHPLHLVLQADTMPTPKALTEFLSSGAVSNQYGATPGQKYLQAERFGSQGFHVSLTSLVYGAADYLAESQPALADLELVRQAVERPYARMDGDYQRPFDHPIPNFVRLRNVAQMLSQRAKCYLLLGQPEAAWHELAMVRDLCRMLEAKPASNSPTLVQTMIDVAINGLYAGIIQDGLRLQAWREPELEAMQKQLMDINLMPLLRVSFNAERAAVCRTFEITPPPQFYKWFGPNEIMPGLWARLTDARSLLASLMPYGWVQQNMCANAIRVQLTIESFDVANNQIHPREIDDTMKEIETTFSSFSPYTWMAAIATPNFAKAIQRMAQNQTLANRGLYRLRAGTLPPGSRRVSRDPRRAGAAVRGEAATRHYRRPAPQIPPHGGWPVRALLRRLERKGRRRSRRQSG